MGSLLSNARISPRLTIISLESKAYRLANNNNGDVDIENIQDLSDCVLDNDMERENRARRAWPPVGPSRISAWLLDGARWSTFPPVRGLGGNRLKSHKSRIAKVVFYMNSSSVEGPSIDRARKYFSNITIVHIVLPYYDSMPSGNSTQH